MTWRSCRPGGHSSGLSCFLGAALTVLILAACWNSISVSALGMLAIAELVADPERYDNTVIAALGHVAGLSIATNRKGQRFYGGLLMEGTASVTDLPESTT